MLIMIFLSFLLIFSMIFVLFLHVSSPYKGPEKVFNFIYAIYINIKRDIYNYISVIKLAKRRGLIAVNRRYPKTTRFIFSSFMFLLVILFLINILMIRGLIWRALFLFSFS